MEASSPFDRDVSCCLKMADSLFGRDGNRSFGFFENVLRGWHHTILQIAGYWCSRGLELLAHLLQSSCFRCSDVSKEKHEQKLHSFLGHHEQTLHQEALEKLWTDALEQGKWPFVFNNVGHDFYEALERLAFSGWWRSRLETNFCHNQGLCGQSRYRLGERSKN